MTSISGVCRHQGPQGEPVPKYDRASQMSQPCSLGQSDTVSKSTQKMGSAQPDDTDGGQASKAEMTAVLGDLEALVTALVDATSDPQGNSGGDTNNGAGRKSMSTRRKASPSTSVGGDSNSTIGNVNGSGATRHSTSGKINAVPDTTNAAGGNAVAANAIGNTADAANGSANPVGRSVDTASNNTHVTGANATDATGDPATVGKKGEAVPTGADGTGNEIGQQNASWWYNWTPNTHGVQASNNAQFVPMIWGQKDMDPATLASVKSSNSPDLLTFNEPDNAGQSNMSVDQAIADWPALESTGKQLSAPAVANANINDPNSWLNQFMTKAQEKNLPVAFIPLHWYGSSHDPTQNVNALHDYIQSVEDKYHLPIWLTEFGLIDFSNKSQPTPQENAQFLTQASQMLDSLPYVQRYSFFDLSQSNPPSSDGTPGNTFLYDANQNVTSVGKADQEAQ